MGPVYYTVRQINGDYAMLISDDGVVIRIPASDIAMQSRYGGGVRVMRLSEGSKVVTLARAPSEEDAQQGDGEPEQDTGLPQDGENDADTQE